MFTRCPTNVFSAVITLIIFLMTGTATRSAQIPGQKKVIEGRLLKSDGTALRYTEVELIPIDSDKISENIDLTAVSGANGAFYFANVPPGKYTLSINFDGKPSELSPYETFFYPSSYVRYGATEFTIDSSTKIRGLIFKLPPALKKSV